MTPRPLFGESAHDLSASSSANGRESDPWTPHIEILPTVAAAAPYPTPTAIRPFAHAIHARSGSSLPTAAACVLAALNLLVTHDANVLGLARRPIPTALFIAVVSRTGWRKSTAFRDAFAGHHMADDIADTTWQDSSNRRGAWEQAQKSEKRGRRVDNTMDKIEEPPTATGSPPVALRQSTTIEALYKRLMLGRPTQMLGLDEAGVLVESWAFRSDQMAKTAAELSSLWDGSPMRFDRVKDNIELVLRERRLTMGLLGQPDVLLKVILGAASSNGLSARLLVSADDTRPKPAEPYTWPAGEDADSNADMLETIILQQRRRQDHGLDLEGVPVLRHMLALSVEAQDQLEEFSSFAIARSDTDLGIHQTGWWVRAAEQATRLAATLAVIHQAYTGGAKTEDVYIEDLDMRDAIALTHWHGLELERLAERQAAHEDAMAAESMVKLLGDKANDPAVKSSDGVLLNTLMVKNARGAASDVNGGGIVGQWGVDAQRFCPPKCQGKMSSM